MKIIMGNGNVAVTTYGYQNEAYQSGVAFKKGDKHEINYSDISVIDMNLEEYNPDLQIEFTRSESVQVVIDKLLIIKNSLMKREKNNDI